MPADKPTRKRAPRTPADPEFAAMGRIAALLTELSRPAARRVLSYVLARYPWADPNGPELALRDDESGDRQDRLDLDLEPAGRTIQP